jgi:hypothetical protein
VFNWQRFVYLLGLALVEAAPAALLLAKAGGGAWAGLIGLTLAGALATRIADGWLPEERRRPALGATAVLGALWLAKAQAGGGYGVLDGWEILFGSLIGAWSGFGLAYLALVCGLYVFWRGLSLLDHDRSSLRALFVRISTALILLILLGTAIGSFTPSTSALASIEVIAFFSAGLLVLALGNISVFDDRRGPRLDGRGLLTLLGTIGLVVLAALLYASFVGAGVARVLVQAARIVSLALLVIFSPLIILFGLLFEWLFSMIGPITLPPPQESREADQLELLRRLAEELGLGDTPAWILAAMQIVVALLPVLALLLLVLYVRRRRAHRPRDEERESLWSWGGLASDLRELLGQLRPAHTRATTLHDALARLRGDDPDSRIRRSYIRLLLRGEAREHPRAADQTPHEYLPVATQDAPQEQGAVATLTAVYEHARYHPGSAVPADADTAEQSWRAIEREATGDR